MAQPASLPRVLSHAGCTAYITTAESRLAVDMEVPMKIEWGNVPGYFGAIALILTIGTIQRDHRERSRVQASKIAVWAVPPKVEDEKIQFCVLLRNASDLPVTEVRLVIAAERSKVRIRFRKD